MRALHRLLIDKPQDRRRRAAACDRYVTVL
jgi:hypothetical protein